MEIKQKTGIVYIESIIFIGNGFTNQDGSFEIYEINLKSNSLYESTLICNYFNKNYKNIILFKTSINKIYTEIINRKRIRKYYQLKEEDIININKLINKISIKLTIKINNKNKIISIISKGCKNIKITTIINKNKLL